jgi:hypothetical protein
VKDNQPTLHADIKSYFETAPSGEVEQVETVGKDHGRIEVRTHTVSHVVDWYAAPRSYPGAPRFPQLTTIAMVESRIERGDKIETEQRSYISSRVLSAAAFADGARGHWAIENNLHWTLEVTSTRTNHACAPATAPKTWPWSATSPSIFCAKSSTNDPSSTAESAPLGILHTCWRYWGRCDVNLDSCPV